MDTVDRRFDVKVSLPGAVWAAGWLFTIGLMQMSFWQGVLAIVLWPYDLGTHFR